MYISIIIKINFKLISTYQVASSQLHCKKQIRFLLFNFFIKLFWFCGFLYVNKTLKNDKKYNIFLNIFCLIILNSSDN